MLSLQVFRKISNKAKFSIFLQGFIERTILSFTMATTCTASSTENKMAQVKYKNSAETKPSNPPSDEEIIQMVHTGSIKPYNLESYNYADEKGFVHHPINSVRAVLIRRKLLAEKLKKPNLDGLPFENYDYSKVHGVCGENTVGYVPIPTGIAGPLLVDSLPVYLPLSTSEGALIASINRGCKALTLCGGVKSVIVKDGMTRAPAIRFQSALKAAEFVRWTEEKENFEIIKTAFDSTSRFAKLSNVMSCVQGRDVYLRFSAFTGDAMGMNMVSKGVEASMKRLKQTFPDMKVITLSGNYCIDKKVSSINWIEGRGKSVVTEAFINKATIENVLKSTTKGMMLVNDIKNRGSQLSGTIGGFNCQAANIVAALFVATGQDIGQVGTSSLCMTTVEATGEDGKDLYISCRMPSLEVGTVGGGTVLPAQAANLDIIGVRGGGSVPGDNSKRLASVICSTVLAGELSLLAALAQGELVESHERLNRVKLPLVNGCGEALPNGLSDHK